MAEPQLSVRSARARALAHELAKRERRSIARVVEAALELYAGKEAVREPAESFYRRIARDYGTDLDLDAVIREDREPHEGIDL